MPFLLPIATMFCILGAELYFMFQPPILPILDARLFYSVADIQGLFSTIGESGRDAYFQHELIDLAFLTSYSFFILFWMKRLYTHRQKPLPVFAIALSLAPGFFDLIETSGILVLLRQYPQLSFWLENTITFATPLKWISTVAVIGFLFDRLRNL
jgi:hypothetical protein